MGMDAAFFDNKRVFKTDKRPLTQMNNSKSAKEELNDSEHVLLINYPTGTDQNSSSKAYHQVYFGKNKDKTGCSFFDANLPGGKREGSCDEMIKLLAN